MKVIHFVLLILLIIIVSTIMSLYIWNETRFSEDFLKSFREALPSKFHHAYIACGPKDTARKVGRLQLCCNFSQGNAQTSAKKNITEIAKYLVKKKYEATKCLYKAFNDTLLIISFNRPLYEHLPLLHQLYDNVFGKVVSCGKAGRINKKRHQQDHLYVDVKRGWLSYQCMAAGIQGFPNYKGYLYMSDDIILNWFNLLGLNRSKIWQGNPRARFDQYAYGKLKVPQWYWWNTTFGLKKCRRYYELLQAMAEDRKSARKLRKKLQMTRKEASQALSIYLRNGNGSPQCGKGYTDLFYIPGRLSQQAKQLINLSYRIQLFLEIAVHNVARSLDKFENFEVLQGYYLPNHGVRDSRNSSLFWQHYNLDIPFIHPFKLNYPNSRDMNLALVRNWVLRFSRTLTDC